MTVQIWEMNEKSPESKILQEAAALLLRGEVILCPVDTCYIFAANALNVDAVDRIFRLKGRSSLNPIHVAVSSMKEAKKYAHVNETARLLARDFLPGALTLVLRKKENVPSILVAGLDTIGVRIPDNKIIQALTAITGLPLTATSANVSGKATPYSVSEVFEQFGNDIPEVACVVDQGPLPPLGTSTIIDVTTSPPRIIREGRVSREALLPFLKH